MRKFICTLFMLLIWGCCYLPLVDYAVLLDYSSKPYLTSKRLYKSDSVNIEISAIAHFPSKLRSKKRRTFLVGIIAHVDKNFLADTLSININNSIVSAIFDDKTLYGDPKVNLIDTQTERRLYVIGNRTFFKEGDLKTEGGVLYKFQYPKSLKDSLESHKLYINFKKLEIRNREVELSPIILDLD